MGVEKKTKKPTKTVCPVFSIFRKTKSLFSTHDMLVRLSEIV